MNSANEINPEIHQILEIDGLMLDVDVPLRSSSTFDSFEPDRRCTTWQPPKTFYRRFWKSVCLRALQRATESARAAIFGS